MEPHGLLLMKKELTGETLVLVLDLVGTFVFVLSGAMAAVKRQLDLFGVPHCTRSQAARRGNAGSAGREGR